MAATAKEFFLETGVTVRWRGHRWRVLEEEVNGFVTLVGTEPANRDHVVTPLVALERDSLAPDVWPTPELDVERSDRARWRALHRSYVTTMAGGREQLVGLDWGAVAVEPYQLVPLMRVARSVRPRLLIADDTGLGKTAEAGLILRWLAQRHQAGRVLIVTRADPEPRRWQQEMWIKFGFRFDILKSGTDFLDRRRQSPTVNVFAQEPRLIVSMTLAARTAFLDELRQSPVGFDVVIVDEAHHLADRGSRTKWLTKLGRELARKSSDGCLLLLTATPHDGKTATFLSLLRFLDPLIEVDENEIPVDLASRLVVRRLKSEVTLAGGRKFIPPKIHVVSTLVHESTPEKAIEKPLNAYLEWLEGEEARYLGEGARQKAKGCQFLAGVYRKRFGSSAAALRATLRRRLGLPPAPEDEDEAVPYVDTEASDPEDEVIDPGAAAEAPPPDISPAEAELARALLAQAEKVPPGKDSKLEALVRLLHQLGDEKVVVFTEYRDTLRAARRRLDDEGISYVVFHGQTSEADREQAVAAFNHDPAVRVFLATDAASEGKNLQRASHNLVHLDVPWNPNRYAQRNGRIDRYGQGEQPHIWALVAADRERGQGRREYRALELIVEKLATIEDELGSVGPILPRASSVGDLLLQAESDIEERVTRVLDDEDLRRAGEELSLLTLRNERELQEAEAHVRRLGSVDDFEETVGPLLRVAFKGWDDGGAVEGLGEAVVRVRISARLRSSLERAVIDRATFRRDVAVAGQDGEESEAAEFLSPGHPLVAATLRLLRDEASDPDFPHRFDVEAGSPEGLVLSYALRFVDGDGRTVEERLEAVEVSFEGQPSRDALADLARLGIDAPASGDGPSPQSIERWRERFPDLERSARDEASRRANDRIRELVELARELQEAELETLALWRRDEERRVETMSFGAAAQVTIESAEEYRERMDALEPEYERRREALRDRASIRLAGLELVGGRLIVAPA